MTTHYRLEIDEVYTKLHMDDEELKTYSTKKVADKFNGQGLIDTGILPPVVRYLSSDFLHVIIERPPSMQMITFKNAPKGMSGRLEKLNIPLPWQVYEIKVTKNNYGSYILVDFNFYLRTSQIWSEKDELYTPYLPNVYHSGRVCNSDSTLQLIKQASTLSEIINILIEGLWAAEFNLDLIDAFTRLPLSILGDREINSRIILDILKDISNMSMSDILNLEFRFPYTSVGKLIAATNNKRLDTNVPLSIFFNGILLGNEITGKETEEELGIKPKRKRMLNYNNSDLATDLTAQGVTVTFSPITFNAFSDGIEETNSPESEEWEDPNNDWVDHDEEFETGFETWDEEE